MAQFDVEEFSRAAERIRKKAIEEGRLIDNPSDEKLESIVEKVPGVKRTIYGSLVAESEPTSRAAAFTENSVDYPFGEDELKLLAQCEKALASGDVISVDRVVGNEESETVVRLTIPTDFAQIAFGGKNLFIPPKKKVDKPDYEMIFFKDEAFESNKSKPLPQKDITIRLAMMPDGRVVKISRNSNYIGEYKKGVFASEDWAAKTKKGGIFLHAGCREDYLQAENGEYNTTRSLMISLSAMGKTTTTCKTLAVNGNEKSWLVQDDGGTLMPDGSFLGFEMGGIFVKTENLTPGEQAEVYYGVLSPYSMGENIYVTDNGDFDFHQMDRTSNGRAVICRRDVMHASRFIDVPRIDNLILLTRGPLMPAISKLTREQAVVYMILGQAMESSAGDPTQAGRIRSQFFYDPFMAGSKVEHANKFYEIIKNQSGMNFYMLNTGSVGEGDGYKKIKLEDTLTILEALVRGEIQEWVDSATGFQVPVSVRTVDDVLFHPEKLYSSEDFNEKLGVITKLRDEAMAKVADGLHPDIKNVL
jgi:phosphoenolpyruvate carboxykinase (ATP)